jgi:hypothetical protein
MSFYLLYDHLDHLLDEADHAQRTRGQVQAYVKLHEQCMQQGDRVTLSTVITVTWMQPVERILHAARIPVDAITYVQDDPNGKRREEALRGRSRYARKLIIAALNNLGIIPDRNLLLTAGLRGDLAHLQTEQLVWEIIVEGEERRIVPLE